LTDLDEERWKVVMALADRDKDGMISKSDFEKTMAEALLDKK
jgi:Ca2+-binding EF-hand superfamily protein